MPTPHARRQWAVPFALGALTGLSASRLRPLLARRARPSTIERPVPPNDLVDQFSLDPIAAESSSHTLARISPAQTTAASVAEANPDTAPIRAGRKVQPATPGEEMVIAAPPPEVVSAEKAAALQQAPARGHGVVAMAKEAIMAWIADDGPSLGASIAFYTIFALAPILLITLGIAGFFFGEQAADGQLFEQIRGLVGDSAATTLQGLVASSHEHEGQGIVGAVVSVVTALVAASAVFVELKRAFDAIFKPNPKGSAITLFVRVRLMSLALILALGFLVVVSLILSAASAAFGRWLSVTMPLLAPVMSVLDIAISTGVLTVAFWMLIRYLPDVPPGRWATWIGALTSAVLFAIGKHLIGLYLARGAVASAYGAAGSFIVVILWVYYSAQILLLGAEVARSVHDPRRAARKAGEGRAIVSSGDRTASEVS